MNILVIGGNGFIGSHVVDALLRKGHFVRVLDRNERKDSIHNNDLKFFKGSVDDPVLLNIALSYVDIVLHCASSTVPFTSNIDPVGDVKSNLIASIQLLDAMKARHVNRIIYLSSGGAVYGHTEVEYINESHPTHPVSSYGIVKVAVENYLFMYEQIYGMKPIIIRPSNPFGEKQRSIGVQGIINTILYKMGKHEPVEIWGDGNIVRDFIYVSDLVELLVKSIESGSTGIYNAGGGNEGYTINEIIACIKQVTNKNFPILYRSSRPFDVNRVVLDINKAKKTFNWNPKINLEEGIARTANWMESYLKTDR